MGTFRAHFSGPSDPGCLASSHGPKQRACARGTPQQCGRRLRRNEGRRTLAAAASPKARAHAPLAWDSRAGPGGGAHVIGRRIRPLSGAGFTEEATASQFSNSAKGAGTKRAPDQDQGRSPHWPTLLVRPQFPIITHNTQESPHTSPQRHKTIDSDERRDISCVNRACSGPIW